MCGVYSLCVCVCACMCVRLFWNCVVFSTDMRDLVIIEILPQFPHYLERVVDFRKWPDDAWTLTVADVATKVLVS